MSAPLNNLRVLESQPWHSRHAATSVSCAICACKSQQCIDILQRRSKCQSFYCVLHLVQI